MWVLSKITHFVSVLKLSKRNNISRYIIFYFEIHLTLNSPRDWDNIGIKKGTLCIIYRWKASLLGNQNIYVNKILSVSIKGYRSFS